jgi:hypothetical protein
MNETAAYWTDHLIGRVPVRHWTGTVPPPLRYMMGHDVGLCTQVLDIYNAAVFRWLRRKAKTEFGLRSVKQAHPAAVTVVHRGSSHLALNVHFHSLVADGVYLQSSSAAVPEFRALAAPNIGEVMSVAWETCQKTMKILRARGQWIDMDPSDDRFAQAQPGLAQCYASSIAGILTLGPHAGQRVMRIGARASSVDNEEQEPSAGQAVVPGFGFSVHAGRRISADDRSGLERVARYVLRPAIAQDRLKLLSGGKVQLELKRAWNDGTTHFIFEQLDFMAKLAALIFPPKMHRIRYFGCWARRAKLRHLVTPHADCESATCTHTANSQTPEQGDRFKRPRYDWAALLQRCFSADVLACPRCHIGRMQRIAWITKVDAIRKILHAVGLPADWPQPAPSRWARQEELFAVAQMTAAV